MLDSESEAEESQVPHKRNSTRCIFVKREMGLDYRLRK
jgi:hypothetical protein